MSTTTTYRSNNKLILLVTSDVLNSGFYIDNTNIQYCHINSKSKIFPSISTLQPGTIIMDHDFLEDEMQNLVRRIRTNPFYDKLKICCLKASFHRKTDEQLKSTGVDYLVYKNPVRLAF
jgi:hypothetical protein